MRFRLGARGPSPLTVVLEPSGAEYILESGDYFEFEWEESSKALMGTLEHRPDKVTIGEGGGRARMWNSSGDELSMFG